MSQFFQPQPTLSLPRPMFEVPMPGIGQVPVETPGMPGAVVVQDSSAAQLNGAISQFANATTDLVATRLARDERAALKAERAADKAERDAAKADDIQRTGIMRGIATDVRVSLPGDEAAIKRGSLRPGDADQNDPEIWLDNLVSARLADVPEKFRDEAIDYYKRLWAPRGLGALQAKAESDRKRGEQITLDGFADEVVMLGVNNDMEGLYGALTRGLETPGVDPEKVRDRAATAMLTLARDGHRDAVASIKSWLGDNTYQKESLTADDLIDRFDDRVAREQGRLFANDAADIRKRVSDGKLTLELGVREIERAAKDRNIESRFIENETQGLEAAIRKRDADEVKREREEAVGQMKRAVSIELADQAINGFRPTFTDRVVGIDEDGKPIVYSGEAQQKDAFNTLRIAFNWPTQADGSPDPLGWQKLDAREKEGYLGGLERMPDLDPFILDSVRGMNLRTDEQATATAMDVRAVDTLRQIRAVSPVYAQRLVAAGGIEAKYAHLASIFLDTNPDTQAAITRAKQLYKQHGDRIERMEPSQAADILAVEPQLQGNLQLLQAAATEAGIRILGKTGDTAKMRSAAAKEAVEYLRPFTLEVNGRLVNAGPLASNKEADREVTSAVMTELMTGKVNEYHKADARRSKDPDDYTLEMVNAELYRLVNANDPTEQAPRNVDPMIRVSDIESLVTARMAAQLKRPVRQVAELERLIADAKTRNAKVKSDMQARAELVNADVRFQSGVGRMLPVQSFIDIAALEQELNVARVLERQKKK